MRAYLKTKHGGAWVFFDSKDAPVIGDALDRWIRGNALVLFERYLEEGALKFAPGVNPADLWADITDNGPRRGSRLLSVEDAAEYVNEPRTEYYWPAFTVTLDGYDVAAALKKHLKGVKK